MMEILTLLVSQPEILGMIGSGIGAVWGGFAHKKRKHRKQLQVEIAHDAVMEDHQSASLIDQVKHDEGYRAKPYRCSQGYLTIGYGRNLEKGISKAEGDYLFKNDVKEVERQIKHSLGKEAWYKAMNQARKDVIFQMVYQMGWSKFCDFSQTIRLLTLQKYDAAADEMLDSAWASQTPLRAQRLARQMRSGFRVTKTR